LLNLFIHCILQEWRKSFMTLTLPLKWKIQCLLLLVIHYYFFHAGMVQDIFCSLCKVIFVFITVGSCLATDTMLLNHLTREIKCQNIIWLKASWMCFHHPKSVHPTQNISLIWYMARRKFNIALWIFNWGYTLSFNGGTKGVH
jgi:hypothetical protein